MGTFYQIQGKSKEMIDNSEEGLSFFKRKYSNIKPFSIVNREYKFHFDNKNNNIFKIPLDGHLIKNIYFKANIELNEKKEEINEWKELKIFDNPYFINYTKINIPKIENINLEVIYNNLKNMIYNNSINDNNNLWQENIMNYYHNDENNLTIIKNILNYYDIETNLLESLNNNLVEYKNAKVLNIINFYINVIYLFYNNLINLEKVYSNRLVLTESSITNDYLLTNFLDKYSFYYENNDINKLYIQQQLDFYINDLRIKLQNEKIRQDNNSINNITTLDYGNNYEIYINNILLELNENIWTIDIINAFSVEISNDNDNDTENTIGKINEKYTTFINQTLVNIYYNLYDSNFSNNDNQIIDSSNKYYSIYINFIYNINNFIYNELIINQKYKDIFDLQITYLSEDNITDINVSENNISDIININLNDFQIVIDNDISNIKNFYYDYNTIINIDLSEYTTIQSIKDNIFDKINFYQYYNLSFLKDNNEFKYIDLLDKYDFKPESDFLLYTIYNDNENILIHEYKKKDTNIIIEDENLLREYIYNFNLTNDDIYINLIREKFPLFELNLFNLYPFYNFEKVIIKERTFFSNFKNIVILHSYLNPIFLEEMYHEYVYERKKNIKEQYNINIDIDISKYENDLDDYQKQIIQSYTFYNKTYFEEKIPNLILNIINDIHKYKYFHILNYENFLEFTRTNYNYFMYLYNEWNKKLQGKKKWNYLLQIKYKGQDFTFIELKHIIEIEKKIGIYDINEGISTSTNETTSLLIDDYNIKYEESLKILNEKYQKYINTEIFEDLDLLSIKVKINYNNNLKLNLKLGKRNFSSNIKINKIFLYSNTVCILYYEHNYRNIAYIFENMTENTKIFFVRKNIKSIFVYPFLMNTIKYKGLNINIDQDISNVFGNDIFFDFSENKYIRKFDSENNIYLYLELYRWILYNDFYNLITSKYKDIKFEKINLQSKSKNNIFKYINLQIDDQIIETLCDDTLNIYQKYFIKNKKGFDKLLQMNYIPLIFWFMRNEHSSFPIISLSNTNVYLNIKCFDNVIIKNNISSIIIDYILLSPEERNEIILKDHVYILNSFNQKDLLINKDNNFLTLPFNSQIIDFFIIFYNDLNEIIEINKYIKSLKLKIDGKESVKYYDLKFHTNVTVWNSKYKGIDNNIINISFAINPILSEQPSGSMNYSCITDSVLKFIIDDKTFYEIYKYSKIIFRDYKYIKINSGQGSLI